MDSLIWKMDSTDLRGMYFVFTSCNIRFLSIFGFFLNKNRNFEYSWITWNYDFQIIKID